MTMPGVVYILCLFTSLAIAILLLRAYRRSETRLLLWSSLCFFGMALNNGLLYLDLMVGPTFDLSTLPRIASLVSALLLTYGLIWEAS
jgi:hypothetical protein